MRLTLYSCLTFFLLSLTQGCSTLAIDVPLVYEIDIDQGNIIDQEMVNMLKPNMSKRQVIYILGSPLLIDPFHTQQWDYIYSQQDGGENRSQQRISLIFEQNTLKYLSGDLAPQQNPDAKKPINITVEAPKREFKKTLYELISDFF